MDLKKNILKYALQNAVQFNGKANPGAVMGKIFADNPELREKAKEIGNEVLKVIKEISKLSVEQQKEKLKDLAPELLKKKEKQKKKELPELKNAVKGKVITRIPPEPSKYNHIGHALSFLLNYLYAKKYNGKCILRFEDTNPLTSTQEYVDAMNQDVLDYLDIKPSKTIFASDDLPNFYEMAEQLIKQGKAYVCFCDRDAMKSHRFKGTECNCRNTDNKNNLEEWNNMLNKKYKDGHCSLRLKIDMQHKNYTMRDPVIMRICTHPHYRQKTKYTVWPMYDFENAIEDSTLGITHILRSSEFGTMRIELQDYIKDLFNLPKQTIIQYGRFNIRGAITKGREIRELIEKKKVIGWDDPRLVTLRALKRRGIVREAFYELALEVGLSRSETNLDWSLISTINRRILDSKTERYFFIEKPKLITIDNAPEQNIKLKLHPEFQKKGYRNFKTKDKFYITEKDYKEFKDNKLYRLMDCLNFVKKKNKFLFDSLEHEKYKEKGEAIIHWLPYSKDLVDVEILMPDAKVIKGLAEDSVKKLKVDSVIQFERMAFCRLDKKEKDKFIFWFTHK